MTASSESATEMASEWMRMADAAARLGINRSWVHKLANRGTLVVKETPYGRVVSVASVEAYRVSPARKPGRPPKE